MSGPRLAFLGSPEVAARTLSALVDGGYEVVSVVSGPDRRRAREAAPTPTPVKRVALSHGLPVGERASDVLRAGADLGIVVAFGKLVKPDVLSAVPMLNVHFSLLPRWRGAAPVERAILAGDTTTGVCLMALEEGLDTGPVYDAIETPIRPGETAVALRDRLGELGTQALLGLLGRWPDLGEPRPQAGEPTYAAKLTVDDLRIDWSAPAVQAERQARVGRAWTTFRGRRLLVLSARAGPPPPELLGSPDGAAPGVLDGPFVCCGDTASGGDALELLEVQAEGRAAQSFAAWAHGARPAAGERLGGG